MRIILLYIITSALGIAGAIAISKQDRIETKRNKNKLRTQRKRYWK